MRRMIGVQEVEDIALGAAVLGTGGGGDPYIGKLMATQAIGDHGPVELVSIDEMGDEEWSVAIAMMGAPTVMVEKMPGGGEAEHAFNAVQSYLGKPIKYIYSIEAGGINSTIPIALACNVIRITSTGSARVSGGAIVAQVAEVSVDARGKARVLDSSGLVAARHKLEEIADKYGLSRERIRQIEKDALTKLAGSERSGVCLLIGDTGHVRNRSRA